MAKLTGSIESSHKPPAHRVAQPPPLSAAISHWYILQPVKSTLTHHYPLKSWVYIKIPSWWYTFCGFRQMYNMKEVLVIPPCCLPDAFLELGDEAWKAQSVFSLSMSPWLMISLNINVFPQYGAAEPVGQFSSSDLSFQSQRDPELAPRATFSHCVPMGKTLNLGDAQCFLL